MTKEVLTLALEALKLGDTVFYPQTSIAIAAIERALAQPTPAEYAMGYAEGFEDGCKPKPEQEPIGEAHLMQKGFTHCIWSETCVPVGTKLYTTPPQCKTLTDKEIEAIWEVAMFAKYGVGAELSNQPFVHFARAIEAKLKEKNNG